MKWEQCSNDDDYHRLNIEADWSELAADYEDIMAEYTKVRVSGFRPGKAPRTVVEKRFQKEITDDLSRRVVQRLGREAVREAGIEVLGSAEVDKIECVKDHIFRAKLRFHPMPNIDLPDLDKLINGDVDTEIRDRISLTLIEQVNFTVPDWLVKDELALDGLESVEPGSAEWEVVRNRIKLMLILKKVAQQKGIEVDETDVNNRIAEKAREFGTKEKKLRAELEKGDGLQRLTDMLLAESTLDYLIERNQS